MIAEIKKRIFEKSPERLFALILVIYWALHPNRPKVLIVPSRQKRWLIFWKDNISILTSPKCLISISGNPYEQDTRYLRIELGDIVVDVGAGVGEFTIPAAKSVGKEGLVVALEPEPRNFAALKDAVFDFDNVCIVNKCAWNRKEKVRLFLGEQPGLHSLVSALKRKQAIEVQADTLDNICLELGIDRVDFIKMDIEGAELEALEGAKGVLKAARKIVIETHRRNEREPTWPKVQQFLENNGFKTYVEDEIVHAWKFLNS